MPSHTPRYIEKPVPVSEALRVVKENTRPVTETETIPVWNAVGRVLARDIVAEHDFPPRPRSAYDGYAVRASETPGRFRVVGEATIGRIDVELRIEPGTAAYVSTGAYLPDGADVVVPEEAVKREGEYIVVDREFKPGKNLDPIGAYARKGQVLLPKGYVLDMLDVVGLLDVAVTRVEVYRRVRVGIIATGTELFEPSNPDEARDRILRGEVAETTAKLVEYAITRYAPWATVVWRVMLPDNVETIAWYLTRQGKSVDIAVFTGGTGPSNVDAFYQLAETLNARILFRGLLVRGGRPTSAMILDNSLLVLALSGHPISAFHGFLRLLYPILKHLGNVKRSTTPPIVAYARLATHYSPELPRPVKVKLRLVNGVLEATPLPRERQHSSVTISNVEADGIAVFKESRVYNAGELVPVYIFREPEGYED